MFFAIIILLFVAGIVFFHYLQGFFSATLSAIFTVIAAVFAFSYHETIVENYLGGRMADSAHALVLLGLFAVIYLALRIIFDNFVPGALRLPAALDKGGAAVMGLVAGIFAGGILAIAAQELPFGISIGGYTRYAVSPERKVSAPQVGRNDIDSKVSDELESKTPGKFGDEGSASGLPLLPVDNIVVDTVEKLSGDGGTLDDGHPLTTVHPRFLDELFGQRMGIEIGGSHVLASLPAQHLNPMQVQGLYHVSFPADRIKDGEMSKMRAGGPLKATGLSRSFLVVRVLFSNQAPDKVDLVLRFSPGSARLVVPARGSSPGQPTTFEDKYPIGSIQDAGTNTATLYLNKMDDYMFVNLKEHEGGADLVYDVDENQFKDKAPPGTFFEFKRMARVELGGEPVHSRIPANPNVAVMRKPQVMPLPDENAEPTRTAPQPQPTPTAGTPTPEPAPAPPPADAKAFDLHEATASDALPVAITAPAGADGKLVQLPGGTGVIKSGKVSNANVESTIQEQSMPQKVTQVAAPPGQSIIQVNGTPAASAPWGFATETEQYELVDSSGKRYQPNGFEATYDTSAGQRLDFRFIDTAGISGGTAPDNATPPKQVTFFYVVPSRTKITEFDDHGKKAHDLNVVAK
jgi:hypothetical protein